MEKEDTVLTLFNVVSSSFYRYLLHDQKLNFQSTPT